MSGKTASLIGSTGMIGTYLLELLLQENEYETVRILVRRPQEKTHPKLEVKLVDFSDQESVKLALDGSDIVFCTVGTTQSKVKGDRIKYGKIDFDIPVKAARNCKQIGCEKFVTVTCVGANSKSGNFYLKLKGHVEDALKLIGLESIHVMQPSMLLGERKERRVTESFMKGIMKVLSPLLPQKYRAIHGKVVATAMINAGAKSVQGFFTYTYKDIVAVARGNVAS